VATLAVRSLTPRDVPALRHVRQLRERVDLPGIDVERLPDVAQRARALLPNAAGGRKVYVAFVDGELCASLDIEPDERRAVWIVRCFAAGSPRLQAYDDVARELWEALLEFAIARAGEARIRRVFAAAHEDSVAHASLRAAGFEAYTRLIIVAGDAPCERQPRPAGMRRQERSDVWAVHQLYHRITPRAVQFAEARTSSTWELPARRRGARLPFGANPPVSFVLESSQRLTGYCQVRRGHDRLLVELMTEPGLAEGVDFALAAIQEASGGTRMPACLVTPGYASERISQLAAHGFAVADERLAMIRHTTAPAWAHARVAPQPALEVVERAAAPAGIPSYS
jgi:hypothetical protein